MQSNLLDKPNSEKGISRWDNSINYNITRIQLKTLLQQKHLARLGFGTTSGHVKYWGQTMDINSNSNRGRFCHIFMVFKKQSDTFCKDVKLLSHVYIFAP